MINVKFKGQPLTLLGNQLTIGEVAPDLLLTANDMSDIRLHSLRGKALIVSTLPSLDTPVCSLQSKRFSSEADKLSDKVKILTVSLDLPFAQKRWCGSEGVTNIITASDFKYRTFGEAFGVLIKEWALLSRAVFLFDGDCKLRYVEYVADVSNEPNYEKAIKALATFLN
jgi:thiol peroxidase